MPELTTETITRHTLVLTDDELHALRQAALCAIEHHPEYEHADTWKTFGKLGKAKLSRAWQFEGMRPSAFAPAPGSVPGIHSPLAAFTRAYL